jgi:site-specific recombinase XerD
MEILGHSNLAMTRVYEHVLGSVLQDAATRLESLLGAAASAD